MNTSTENPSTRKTVILGVDDNRGYSPEQISTRVTLLDLLESVQQAIEEFGEDAKVVIGNGQRYGAAFGRLESFGPEVVITDANPDDDEDGE